MRETLLERDDVLAAAADGMASARSGSGRWLLLRGEAGSGRTALLTEITHRAAAAGPLRILRAHAFPEERHFAFSLVRQLFPEAGPFPFDDPSTAEEQRILHRLTNDLAADAAKQPVLLAVEDLRFADEPSRRWLGYLTRRLSGIPALLVLTCRPDDPVRDGPERPDGAEAPGTAPGEEAVLCPATGTESPVRLLGPDSIDRLLTAHGITGETARLCATASAGNPMLLRALVADLPEGPTPRGLADLSGTRYRTAVARWLDAGSGQAPRPLTLATALVLDTSAPPEPELVGAVAGLPAHRPGQELRVAPLAQMLAHPVPRETVLAVADPTELDTLRRRLAHLLYESGTPAPDIADQLLRVRLTDEEWMAHTLEEAAETALRDGSLERATSLLRRAVTAPLSPDRHGALTLRLSALEMLQSAAAGTRRLRDSLRRADCHDVYGTAAALSGALAAQGHVRMAMRVMEEAGSALDDEQLVSAFRIAVAGTATYDGQEWSRAAAEMRALMDTAPVSVEPLACAMVTFHDIGTGRLDVTAATARFAARETARVNHRLRGGWLCARSSLLEWADRLDESRALTERGLPTHPEPPDLTDISQQYLITTRATVDLRAGRFQRLIEENTPLLEAAHGGGSRLPYLHALVALAWHELGYGELAGHHLAALGPEPETSAFGWDEVRCARARIHADEGRWEEALGDYLDCGDRMIARGFVSPVAQAWRPGAALALARLGRHAEAVELAEENLRHARAWGTPRVVGVALRAQAMAAGGRRGREILAEAVEVLRTSPCAIGVIEALIDLGEEQCAAGQPRKGRAALDEAVLRARALAPATAPLVPLALRAPRVLDRATRALRVARPRRDPATGGHHNRLTEAEQRIVELAVQGLTNAQICATLHVARRTVETHLTNAYQKLGVARRTQLAARLADTAGE